MAKKKVVSTAKKDDDDDVTTPNATTSDKPSSTSDEKAESDDNDEDNVEEDEALICCCLCYCAVDYSDKSYFSQEARDADDDLEGDQPLLLPSELHDPHNALVFCDGCDRPYHQRCHFVPAIHLPRGDWHCLICTTTPKLLEEKKKVVTVSNTNKKGKNKNKQSAAVTTWTRKQLSNDLYQMDKPTGPLELKWEHATRTMKLTAMKHEVRRLKSALSVQMQNIRLAEMAMKAFTTSRRRQSNSIDILLKSQELCQTLVKLSSAKLRVRVLLQSLERYRKGDDDAWRVLQAFLEENPGERKAWFPFLESEERRMPPRLKEDTVVVPEAVVPKEIHVEKLGSSSKKKVATSKAIKETKKSKAAAAATAKKDDDDSGISLDDLKCCICFKGEATDDNDLLLCDGLGCFRAHHMHCLNPVMTPHLAAQEEDWFCPLCTTIAKLVADVQSEFTGDEWYSEDMGESVTSWEQVDDVFPESPMEYSMAIKWKEKKLDDEARSYLKDFFGKDDDAAQYEGGEDGGGGGGADDMGDDDDDEEDDDFDPTKKAKKSEGDDDDDDDDASTNASLNDMSSVELNIGRKELAALSGGEESSDDDDDDDDNDKSKSKSRRSRRMRSSTRTSRTDTDNESSDADAPAQPPSDIGKLDEANIVRGKRRRRRIDYRVLNDSMFGKLSAKDKAKMDDTDDFQYKHKAKDTTSESESSNDEDSSGDEENEGSTSKEEVSVSSDTKATTTKKRAVSPKKAKRPVQKRRKPTPK